MKDQQLKKGEAVYRCNQCQKQEIRSGGKLWVKSFCSKRDKAARLYRISAIK